ncbi:hypothetical protein P7K49_034075 [Saguinus oedipus]|uniref:Uncharacterized protein n=1 Tax=Saguinus oedipus TaxID=9490 RepID=A0ABQ9TTQ1_SAGOE|nr:hypothetical protein P7K49_034075 [Saguinus oedipus]
MSPGLLHWGRSLRLVPTTLYAMGPDMGPQPLPPAAPSSFPVDSLICIAGVRIQLISLPSTHPGHQHFCAGLGREHVPKGHCHSAATFPGLPGAPPAASRDINSLFPKQDESCCRPPLQYAAACAPVASHRSDEAACSWVVLFDPFKCL